MESAQSQSLESPETLWMLRGCQEPPGDLRTAVPSLLVALPHSTLPSYELPPVAGLAGTVLGTVEGVSNSLDSTEFETWLGELATRTEDMLGLRSTKLNHWTTAPGSGVREGPASIHMTGFSM